MTDVARALYLGITDGKYTPDSEATDPRQIIMNLRADFPSERSMAAALRVPRSSLRRWIRGARPQAAGYAALLAAQRRMRLPRGREAWMRQGQIVLNSIVAFSDDEIPLRRLFTTWPRIPKAPTRFQPQGVQDRILDAWLRANDVEAVAALLDVVWAGLNYGAGRDTNKKLGDVRSIRWFKTVADARHSMRLREM